MAIIAKMGLFLAAAMACMAMSPHLSAGQFLAPSPGLGCTSELVQLLPCVDFLTNSSASTVVPTCCSALSNVSSASPSCLCELISPTNANASAQFNINDTRALELPGLCSLKISPASCSGSDLTLKSPSPSYFAVLGPAVAPAALAISPTSFPTPVQAPGASSPSSTPASPPRVADCNAVTTELLSCADFLADSASSPSSSCCKNLRAVVTSSPACLCEVATQAGSLAMQVNATRVTELPSLCSISVVLSDCSSAAGPLAPAGPRGSPFASAAQPASASNLFMVIGLCLSLARGLLLQ